MPMESIDPNTPELAGAPSNDAKPTGQLPQWLVKLATESWQAELLISGFAIVGTSQLLDLIEPLSEWVLFSVRAALASYLHWVVLYLAIGFLVLPVAFVIHFAIRTFWIGLVGLSSVYPDGFGPLRPSTMLPGFVEQIEQDYPPLHVLIDRIETVASILFAVAAVAMMVFISFAAVLLVIFGLSYGVSEALPQVSFAWVFNSLVGLLCLVWLVSVLLVSTPLKRNARAQQVYVHITKWFRKVTYTIFDYPATYITTLLMTNVRPKRFVMPVVLGYLLIFAGMILVQSRPMMNALSRIDRLSEQALRTDYYYAQRYSTEWPEGYTPLNPYTTHEVLAPGVPVPVFLPLLGEDEHRLEQLRPALERPDALADPEWRAQLRADRVARLKEYYRFRYDSLVVTPLELAGYQPQGSNRGVRVLLPATLSSTQQVNLYVETWNPASQQHEARALLPFRVRSK